MKEKQLALKRSRSQPKTPRTPKLKPSRSKLGAPSVDAEDENLLEKVWLNTVEEDCVEVLACTSQEAANLKANGRSRSAPRSHQNPTFISEPSKEPSPRQNQVKHHPSSPTMNLVMRHEEDPEIRREIELRARKEEALRASRRIQRSNKPPQDVCLKKTASELSAITSPTVFMTGRRKVRKHSSTSSIRPQQKRSNTFDDEVSLEESLLGEEIVESAPNRTVRSSSTSKSSKKHHFFSEDAADKSSSRPKSKGKQPNRRRHSSSSIASEVSCTLSEELSDLKYLYSRTATTMTRSTQDTLESGIRSARSECNADIDMRKPANQNMSSPICDRKYGTDKYAKSSNSGPSMSAASKGKMLIESVRNKGSSAAISPRHGKIVVTNVPILSKDSLDNVEVEYAGEQFGMI